MLYLIYRSLNAANSGSLYVMRSKQLNLQQYDTDKINHRYLEWYDPFLQSLVDQEIKLLELGIYKGGSLRLWRDYFPKATIVGIDLNPPKDFNDAARIQMFRGSQDDVGLLTEVARETAPDGFDVIIDDASHLAQLTKTSFWHLFTHHLKPSGLYVIEDWGTGYWDDWPDGKSYQPPSDSQSLWAKMLKSSKHPGKDPRPSHNYGMVGLVKELIDEQGAADLSRGRGDGQAQRTSRFDSVTVTQSIVFIKKRSG